MAALTVVKLDGRADLAWMDSLQGPVVHARLQQRNLSKHQADVSAEMHGHKGLERTSGVGEMPPKQAGMCQSQHAREAAGIHSSRRQL